MVHPIEEGFAFGGHPAYPSQAVDGKVLADLGGLNPRQVSDLSHGEASWRLVNFGDTIRYEAALVRARQVSTPTRRSLSAVAGVQSEPAG